MRALFLLSALLLLPLPLKAEENGVRLLPEETLQPLPLPPLPTEGTGEAQAVSDLDALYTSLRRERSTGAAGRIASRIEARWNESGSATVDLLLLWSREAEAGGQTGTAFDLLEQAMVLAPEHAEAWNRRASLNYQLSRYGRALTDIEQTLRREPRHFGALMGLAVILETIGREEEALDAYMRVLAVYPALRDAQDAVARLTSESSGRTL